MTARRIKLRLRASCPPIPVLWNQVRRATSIGAKFLLEPAGIFVKMPFMRRQNRESFYSLLALLLALAFFLRSTDAAGSTTTYCYNALNRLQTLTVNATGSATPLASYAYTLAATGNRTSALEGAAPSAPVRTINYAYDSLWRLQTETITGDANGHNGQIGYTFDPVGNRLQTLTGSWGSPCICAYAHMHGLPPIPLMDCRSC